MATFDFGTGDDYLDEQRLKVVLENIADAAATAGARERQSQADFQTLLVRDYGPMYDAMDTLYTAAVEASQWSAKAMIDHLSLEDDEDRAIADWNLVLRGIAARALAVYAEIVWLLRGGFGGGATARLRTMHELTLTALVLMEHGRPGGTCPDLATRFVAHRDAFLITAAADILRGREGDHDVPESVARLRDKDLQSGLQERRNALVEMYGPPFAKGMWGWACALFPEEQRVTTTMMSNKANQFRLTGLQSLYREASIDDHAGSDAWHRTFQTWGDTTVLTAGASSHGIRMPAHFAGVFLQLTLATVIPTRIESDGTVVDLGGYFTSALRQLNSRVDPPTNSAED